MKVVGVAKKAIMYKGLIFNVGSKLDLEMTESEYKALEECICLAIERGTIVSKQDKEENFKKDIETEKVDSELETITINVEDEEEIDENVEKLVKQNKDESLVVKNIPTTENSENKNNIKKNDNNKSKNKSTTTKNTKTKSINKK